MNPELLSGLNGDKPFSNNIMFCFVLSVDVFSFINVNYVYFYVFYVIFVIIALYLLGTVLAFD